VIVENNAPSASPFNPCHRIRKDLFATKGKDSAPKARLVQPNGQIVAWVRFSLWEGGVDGPIWTKLSTGSSVAALPDGAKVRGSRSKANGMEFAAFGIRTSAGRTTTSGPIDCTFGGNYQKGALYYGNS
jgi:hypothetical protein